jgi:hypothetical protein
MAGGKLLVLLDDIAVLLDDIAVMTKAAAKKTAGVLGDDLALNAQQVTGMSAKRELPVIWSVFKGSLINKVILVIAALLISSYLPWLVIPLLMIGGAYLCYEGCEKVFHRLFHKSKDDESRQEHLKEIAKSDADMVQYEKEKIKGAIRTDFILSAEILAITLGVVGEASLTHRIAVLTIVALLVTVFVYGLVALIVKIDDFGLWLFNKTNLVIKKIGYGLVQVTPYLMKALSLLGTIAMFLVGGGIIAHGIAPLHHFIENLAAKSSYADFLVSSLLNGLVGLIVGSLLIGIISIIKNFKNN